MRLALLLSAAALPAMLPAAGAGAMAPEGIVLPPAVHSVGPGCDFNSIQAAIDAAESGDSVHLVSGINFIVASSLSIDDKSLSLVGGFPSCDAAVPDPESRSTLTGAGFGSVLELRNAVGPTHTVLLRHLQLRNGSNDADGGGGLDVFGDLLVRVDNVRLQENEAMLGGGIRLRSAGAGATLRLEGGTVVGGSALGLGNNATTEGGGIWCEDAAIEWIDARIQFNTALSGAGMYLIGCDLSMPPILGGGLRQVGLFNNQALSGGGGMSAIGGSSVALASSPQRLVRIADNSAGQSGGGVLMIGSQLFADGVQIEQNSAGQSGGGVSMSDSLFDLDRGTPTGSNCPVPERCASVSRNVAAVSGGAVFAVNASEIDLRGAFVDLNQSSSAAAVLSSGPGAVLLARSVQFAGNVASNGNGALFFGSNSSFDLQNVTVAENTSPQVFRLITGSTLDLADSIVWQPGNELVSQDGSATLVALCVNASDDLAFPALTHAPDFEPLAPAAPPLLRPAATSANLDACFAAVAPSPGYDALGNPRLADQPDVPDLDGTLDRGAVERLAPLFRDGFEEE